jgi:phosphatidylglycerophosphatase C
MKLALFDFDGTISTQDSMIEFVRFTTGKFRFYRCCVGLSPFMLAFILKRISNDRMKEKFLTCFFGGTPEKRFQELASRFAAESLNRIIRPAALERIKWHQQQSHRVVVVSASADYWLKDWCSAHGLELISTRLEVADGKITGRLAGANCYGEEKVRRIREKLDPASFEYIYAYGDSNGDTPMLKLADEPHMRYFE